ncbi:uncharacterized protein VSU04_017334 [Chlamydotis macqueenii]
MAALAQEPVTFEDVAVYLSRAEWDAAAEGQRELYRSVMLDTYELLASLGYPGPKPDVLHRVERGEAPWVCEPQSPVRWDGPRGPSPGRGAGGSRLEGPGAGGRRVPEERAQTPDQGGRCAQWRLRTRRLLRKFGGGSGAPAEAAGRAAGPEESGARARTAGTEPEAQHARAGAAAGSGRLPLHPAAERQDAAAERQRLRGGPAEGFPGGAAEIPGAAAFPEGSGALPAEGRGEAVWKEHCYCAAGAAPLPPLREHDYCGRGLRGVAALRDHQYCHLRGVPYRGWGRDGAGDPRAALRRLARRKSRIGRILRRAKRVARQCRGCGSARRASPQGPSGAACPSGRAVPPAAAQDDPAQAARAASFPAEPEVARPACEGGRRGGASEGLCAPAASSAAAAGAKSEATRPAESAPRQAPGPQPMRGRGGEGRERVPRGDASLRDAYRAVLRAVGHVLDAVRHDWRLGGRLQRKELWPVVIRIDS